MQWIKNKFLTSLGISSILFSGMTMSLEAWDTPQAISTTPSSVNPSSTNIVIDENSNVVVGWLEGTLGIDTNLMSSFWSSGAPSWSTPNALYTGTSPEFPCFPILRADSNGKAYAFFANFHQGETSYDQTTAASTSELFLDTAWGTTTFAATLEGFPNGGGVGVDELGNSLAVLALTTDSSTNSPPYAINMMALASDGVSWTTPVLLGTDESSLSGPVVFTAAANGQGTVGWKLNDGELTFQAARYSFETDTVTPINNIPLPSGTVDVGFAKHAIGLNGDITVVFGVRIGSIANYILYSSFLPAGSDTWTYPAAISDPSNSTGISYLSIDMDRNNNSGIVWAEVTTGGDAYIRTAILPFGGSLLTITNLTPAILINEDSNSGAMINVDAFGNAVATWNLVVEGTSAVQVSSAPAGGSWSTAETLSSTGYLSRVALSDQGTAALVWLDTETNYLYGTTSALFPVNAPSSFGGYITEVDSVCYLNMHWSPSLAPNIANYKIYRGSTLIATVSASGPFATVYPVDCNFVVADYTIVAEASNGNESAPVTLVLAY